MDFQKVLIVDDSSTSRMIIKRCFEIAGLTDADYYEAEDGMAAISLLKGRDVDLILTDLRMPKMDGETLIRKLRIIPETQAVPVVVISSIGKDDITDHLIELGASGVIRKPMSPEKAIRALGVST